MLMARWGRWRKLLLCKGHEKVRNLSREEDCFKFFIMSKTKVRGEYFLLVKKNESNRLFLKNMIFLSVRKRKRNQHWQQNGKTRLWVTFLVLVIGVLRDNHKTISSRESFFPLRLILHPLPQAGTRWRPWYGNIYLTWLSSAFCVTDFPQDKCHNSCSTSVLLNWIKW